MIKGHATQGGTVNFVKKSMANQENFRKIQNLTLSNVGIGTYLGNPDSNTDTLVENAVKQSILAGINVIDTAINYRLQKAERSVGKAIAALIKEGRINRDEVFISTKNGYVTNDGDINEDFWSYINREYVKTGIIKPDDISSGYHCMTVSYLEDQLNRSRKNLDLDCIDLIYLHNAVEGQIQDITKTQFIENLKNVFKFYESQRQKGTIKFYGLATWECFRVKKDNQQFLLLSDVLELAKQAGGDNHGFRFIQLPFNMYLDHAYMLKNQQVDGKDVSILEAAMIYNIGVFTSVPLMQGRLLGQGVIPEFDNMIPSLRCMQFIRSVPGVLAPLVGHKLESHVSENLEIMKIPKMSEIHFNELVKKLIS